MKELLALPEPPAFVTMVDIDDTVMDACSEHMPSVCGKYLARDNREGQRHKIVTGCALQYIKVAMVRAVYKLKICSGK